MALNEALLELVKQLGDEKDRATVTEMLEKHEPLRAGYLRQADYDRNMNQVKAEREAEQKRLSEAEGQRDGWKVWWDKNKPIYDQTMKDHGTLQSDKQKLQEEMNRYKAAHPEKTGEGNNAPVDEAALTRLVEAEVGKRGYVSTEQLAKIIDEKAQELNRTFLTQTMPGTMRFLSTVNQLHWRHRDEFGRPLDETGLMKYMAENKVDDPERAYLEITKTDREKLHTEQKKQEEEKIREDERQKERSRQVPGAGAPPAGELGSVQMRLQKKGPAGLPEDAELGTGAIAAAAGKELRDEGKV